MPKSRHHYLLILLLVFSVACQRERGPKVHDHNSPYGPGGDGAGTRIVVRDAEGEPFMKVRVSKTRVRVYDDQMVMVGMIREFDDHFLVEQPGEYSEKLTKVKEPRAIELKAKFRAEPVADGWAVFDANAKTVGYLTNTDGVWSLRDDYSSEARLTAKPDQLILEPADGNPYTLTRRDTPGPLALAMTLEPLDPMARAALGVWLDRVSQNKSK